MYRTFLLVVAAVLATGCSDVIKQNYASYQEALDAGAIREGGFLPSFLPKHVAEIREVHDLDTNWSLLVFRFDPRKEIDLADQCFSRGAAAVEYYKGHCFYLEKVINEIADFGLWIADLE